MSPTPKTQSFKLPNGREISIQTGKLATQAHGSVEIRSGKLVMLATVVSNYEPVEGQSWFPLFVDYQEKFSANGKIPGNFHRREGRLSDHEVLVSRLVDRAIRPLFPDGYMNETQVFIQLLSADEDDMPDAFAALAASAALAVSDIPFGGPISEVRVARINGQYHVNPGREELKGADLDIILAASLDNIMMVEGESKEVSEDDLIEAIKIGHEAIKTQCQAQLDLANQVGEKATVKREFDPPAENAELDSYVDGFAKERILAVANGAFDKGTRKDKLSEIKEELIEDYTEKYGEELAEENLPYIKEYLDKLKKKTFRHQILDTGKRLDGRSTKDVRGIWTEIDYLPAVHGSAVFTRGETQAIASLTLGSKKEELMVDNALSFGYENFILHYNFPAFSVGEVKGLRGPGRREIGHANLAQRSLKQVLPEDLEYTIRLISDILESNGSSSMATVCAGSMSLMDAGIQTKAPVAGIAMGLISEDGKSAILSDILGDEDAIGDMDFKLTGTEQGITGCQMDIKIDGLSYELLKEALLQAKEGRLHILGEMAKTITEPRSEVKPFAPRIHKMIIEKDYIGAVIGPGGKIIQEMQEVTGTTITIEEEDGKGHIYIAGNDADGIQAAIDRINDITYEPKAGEVVEGEVLNVLDFGVVVGWRGKSGLLHISEISNSRIDKVSDHFKVGDKVRVKIIGIDKRNGKIKLSRKALLNDENNAPS